MKAEQFLRQGADVLDERGKEYDKPEGERAKEQMAVNGELKGAGR